MADPFKILKDLELKAVGLDPTTMKQQEGYFVAFRDIGLPIRGEDFNDPWSPQSRAKVELPQNTDPSDAQQSGSKEAGLDPERVYDDALLTEISRSQRAFLNTFMVTNAKLQMSPRYSVMPGASNVFDTWWAIVTGANGIPGKLELSPELQRAYDKAQSLLMTTPTDPDEEPEPTRAYERYLEYSDAYDSAVEEYNQAYAEAVTDPNALAQFPMTGNILRKRIDKAFDRWVGLGGKEKIEAALNTLAAQGQDPAMALISRAKKDLAANLFDFPGVGSLPLTRIIPSNWADEKDNRGWNTYSKTDFHSEVHYQSSSTSVSASAGLNLGFWSAGANFSHDSSRQAMDISGDNLEIEFSYMVADVSNAVVKPTLLNLKNWFLYGDYPAHAVSDGTMGQQKPGTNEHVFLPSMITGLILVKDIRIKWDNWKSEWESKTSSTRGSASFGWGPFAASGSYGTSNHRFDASTDRESEGLKIEGIQLVGYVSQIMPASPGHASRDFMQEVKEEPQPQPVG